MRNLVIIPTYNELDNIRPMIDKVFSLPEKFDLLFFATTVRPTARRRSSGSGRKRIPNRCT